MTFAELLGALSIILVGVLFKDRLNRKYVFVNLLGMLLFVITSELNLLDLPLLIPYVFFGVLIAYFKIKRLYGLFGSIVYGSLLLAITFLQLSALQEVFNKLLIESTSTNLFFVVYYGTILAYWIIFAVFAFVLGWVLRRR